MNQKEDNNTPVGQTGPRRRRWPKLLLIGSLAINLLFVGAIIGRLASGPRPALPAALPRHLGWALAGLEQEERAALTPILRHHIRESRGQRRALAAAQRRLFNLLQAETLDRGELTDAFRALEAASSRAQTRMHEALGEMLLHMNAEQRRRAFGHLREDWRRRWRQHRPHRRSGDRPHRRRRPDPEQPARTSPSESA